MGAGGARRLPGTREWTVGTTIFAFDWLAATLVGGVWSHAFSLALPDLAHDVVPSALYACFATVVFPWLSSLLLRWPRAGTAGGVAAAPSQTHRLQHQHHRADTRGRTLGEIGPDAADSVTGTHRSSAFETDAHPSSQCGDGEWQAHHNVTSRAGGRAAAVTAGTGGTVVLLVSAFGSAASGSHKALLVLVLTSLRLSTAQVDVDAHPVEAPAVALLTAVCVLVGAVAIQVCATQTARALSRSPLSYQGTFFRVLLTSFWTTVGVAFNNLLLMVFTLASGHDAHSQWLLLVRAVVTAAVFMPLGLGVLVPFATAGTATTATRGSPASSWCCVLRGVLAERLLLTVRMTMVVVVALAVTDCGYAFCTVYVPATTGASQSVGQALAYALSLVLSACAAGWARCVAGHWNPDSLRSRHVLLVLSWLSSFTLSRAWGTTLTAWQGFGFAIAAEGHPPAGVTLARIAFSVSLAMALSVAMSKAFAVLVLGLLNPSKVHGRVAEELAEALLPPDKVAPRAAAAGRSGTAAGAGAGAAVNEDEEHDWHVSPRTTSAMVARLLRTGPNMLGPRGTWDDSDAHGDRTAGLP